MPNQPLMTEPMLTALAEAPARIAALTAAMAPEQLRIAPVAREWAANEVLAHLRACADMWGASIAKMLAEDRPTIRAVSPRTWIHKTGYPDQLFPVSLEAFARQRAELLALLKPLPPDGWSRSATVTGAGRPYERTVLHFVERLATHERPHVKQIKQIVSAMRR